MRLNSVAHDYGRFSRASLYIFFILLSVNGYTLGGPLLRVYLVGGFVLCVAVLFLFLTNGRAVVQVKHYDFAVVAFVFFCLASSFLNYELVNLTYLFVIIAIFSAFYFVPLFIVNNSITANSFLRISYYSFIGVLFMATVDYVAKVLIDSSVLGFLPRFKSDEAIYLGFFKRNYGFCTEPGIFAHYLLTVGLFNMIWAYQNRGMKVGVFLVGVILFAFNLITTFSAAGLASILFGVFVYLLFQVNKLNLRAVGGVVVIAFLGFVFLSSDYSNAIVAKLTFQDVESGVRRLTLWSEGLISASDDFFLGKGLGSSDELNNISYLSVYVTMFNEVGFFGVGSLIAFLFGAFLYTLFNRRVNSMYVIPLVSGAVQLAAVSTFYYPFIYVLIASIRISAREEKYAL